MPHNFKIIPLAFCDSFYSVSQTQRGSRLSFLHMYVFLVSFLTYQSDRVLFPVFSSMGRLYGLDSELIGKGVQAARRFLLSRQPGGLVYAFELFVSFFNVRLRIFLPPVAPDLVISLYQYAFPASVSRPRVLRAISVS